MSIPVVTPADVHTAPSRTKIALGSTVTAGNRRASSSHADQWVAARLPSSSPAAASTNAPEHTEVMRGTTRAARRSQPSSAGSLAACRIAAASPPATTTVSRRPGRIRRRSAVRTGSPHVVVRSPPPTDAITTRYAARPALRDAVANTSAGPVRSSVCTPGNPMITTRGAGGTGRK
jgi:hypothetical protein